MSVPYLILAGVSVALGVAFVARYPGKPSRKSPEPDSSLLGFGAAILVLIAGFTRPDLSQTINAVAAVAMSITIIIAIIVWQWRDRRARRAATDAPPSEPGPSGPGNGPA